jgi:hypothetical protein
VAEEGGEVMPTLMKSTSRAILIVSALFALSGCASEDVEIKGRKGLERYLANNKIGSDQDQWIEIRSIVTGQWDRVGLVFGYEGDFGECQNAITGLKKVNYAREYRCVPANGE